MNPSPKNKDIGGCFWGRGVPVYGDKKNGADPKVHFKQLPPLTPPYSGEKPLGNQLSPCVRGSWRGVVVNTNRTFSHPHSFCL